MRLPVLTGPPVSITQSDSRCRSSHRRLSSFHPKIRFASRCQKSAKSMEVKSHFVQTRVFATPSLILLVIAKDTRQYNCLHFGCTKATISLFFHFNFAIQLYLRVEIPDSAHRNAEVRTERNCCLERWNVKGHVALHRTTLSSLHFTWSSSIPLFLSLRNHLGLFFRLVLCPLFVALYPSSPLTGLREKKTVVKLKIYIKTVRRWIAPHLD